MSNPLVAKQYDEWVYPAPVEDLAAWAEKYCQVCDPSLHRAIIWPERARDSDISILVAGCGTSQAAILAYTNPKASVVGIDISANSLSHAERLKKRHDLGNLELRQMDLHDVATLHRSFDLIYATGVLHHLPDTRKGLTALVDATKDDGALCVMLYARYARAGIHMVQDALRRMGAEQTSDGIALTRQVIEALPQRHPAQIYIRGAGRDLSFDAGIVDTFLHAEDHAFTVPEILAMTAECGLAFQGWTDNLDYYPDGFFAGDHPLHRKIAALPEAEQWAVIELLMQPSGFHSFILRKDQSTPIDFDNDLSELIPARRHLLQVVEQPDAIMLSRAGHSLRLHGSERELFLSVDGKTDCAGLIYKCARDSNAAKQTARDFFIRMYRLGHLTFCRTP
jgi:SAM-dependent methyltransferase